MNMNEKDIDHLTRKLMRGTAEQLTCQMINIFLIHIHNKSERY